MIDSHSYSAQSVSLQQVAVRNDRESVIPRSIGRIGRTTIFRRSNFVEAVDYAANAAVSMAGRARKY